MSLWSRGPVVSALGTRPRGMFGAPALESRLPSRVRAVRLALDAAQGTLPSPAAAVAAWLCPATGPLTGSACCSSGQLPHSQELRSRAVCQRVCHPAYTNPPK